MEYIAPINGGPWTNGNPSTGTEASTVAAEAIDHPMSEITNAIDAAGLSQDGADLTQLEQAIVLLSNAGLTKAAVETILTGQIGSHNHNGLSFSGVSVLETLTDGIIIRSDPIGLDQATLYLRGVSSALGAYLTLNTEGNLTLDNNQLGKSIYFTASTAAGAVGQLMHLDEENLIFFANNIARLSVVDSGLVPSTDNAQDLGNSSFRFDDIYATNATIQTSDEDLKTEIADTNLGLGFIKQLRPVQFKWINGGNDVSVQENGEFDPNSGRVDPETGEIDPATRDPLYEEIVTATPGTRLHHGLIAQEVKSVLDTEGVDAAMYTDSGESGGKGIRYNELVPALIKAVQEQSTIIDGLTSRIEALEAV